MKDLVTTSTTQTFFTARELAEIDKNKGLTCFPQTKRGVCDYVSRAGWDDLGPKLARKRIGKVGGGMEYHISLMPEPLRLAYEGSLITAGLKARLEAEHSADDRRIAALKASTLPARARKVMEARAEILKAIEGYAISQGMSRAWGVAQFLEAQAAMVSRQEIEARRDFGEILTEREIASLARPLLLKTGFMIDPERIVVAHGGRGRRDRQGGRGVQNALHCADAERRDDRAADPAAAGAARPGRCPEMMISTDFGVHINPQFVAAMEWVCGPTPNTSGFRALRVTMCTGAVFHIEAAPTNFGAEEIELTILKAHAGLS